MGQPYFTSSLTDHPVSDPIEEDMIISLASGGRALQGLPTLNVLEHQELAHVGAPRNEALLNPPTGLSLMDPTKAAMSIVYCFSQPHQPAAFCNDVTDMGWSHALHMHQHKILCSMSQDGSFQWNEHAPPNTASLHVSEAYFIHCVFIPMKAFQIPRGKMVLSEAALASASRVQTRLDAETFFGCYNPYVSQNVYHLGGVFFREVTITCVEKTSLLVLMTQEFKSTFSNDGSYTMESAPQVKQRIESVTTLGPANVQQEAEFRRKLFADVFCWAVIDKEADQKEDLVGVWELLEEHAHWQPADAVRLKGAAKLLCECWHDSVVIKLLAEAEGHHLPSPEAHLFDELVHRSSMFVAMLSSDPIQQLQSNFPPQPPARQDQVILELFQQLQSLVDEVDHLDRDTIVGAEMAIRIASCFDSMQTPAKMTEEFQTALGILKGYGFDGHGHKSQLYLDELKTMIVELQKIYEPNQLVHIETSWASISRQMGSGSILPYNGGQTAAYPFRYIGDVVVDRSFNQSPSSCESECSQYTSPSTYALHAQSSQARHLIDCLRHHVNPLKHLKQHQSHASAAAPIDNWDCAFEDEDEGDAKTAIVVQEADVPQPVTPFELLVQILQNSDIPAQIALCKLLLSQRSATPLVFPNTTGVEPVCSGRKVPLAHCIQALCFVDVSLAKEQKLCISTDTSLPRVVFLSNKKVQDSHAAIVASRVLHCDFVSQHGRRGMGQLVTPVIEVGVGFLSAPTQGQSDHLACISFHVTGPYQELMTFVEATADVVVLEVGQGGHTEQHPSTSAKVLRWQETSAEEYCDIQNMMIWGQESYVVGEIKRALYAAVQRKARKPRKRLRDVCIAYFLPHNLVGFEELQHMVGQCDFTSIRRSLSLQRSFISEAQAHFELLQVKDNLDEKCAREQRCQQERQRRSRLATEVIEHPMLQLFHKILIQQDATSRRLGVMWLERTISEMMYPLLEEASLRIDTLFRACQKNPKDDQAKEKYVTAKQEYIEKSLGLDNLWRELCHIYEADPLKQRPLAKRAAQHLLDGFPLEILDGDAGVFCATWVESVLVELDIMTRKPDGKAARMFVLSVMGLQSSGKSTLLNLMFGTQLQTSTGRCTRGVYMQLVPSERAEYDYVMLLDTEGIRSPEHFGLKSLEAHDNRLATFGLLPADASIFMVSNEDDSGLKEVLPMVLLAFKGSAMAESCGGRIKAKIVFVYRSVDTNDKKKLKRNMEKLQEYLTEAAEQVANIGLSSTKEDNVRKLLGCSSTNDNDEAESELLQAIFRDFRTHNNEEKSDVKVMGSLKKGCVPPEDTPEWAYGEQIIELREYVHKRVVEGGSWTGMGLAEWAQHLTRVWDCVCSADFELSFRSAVEYSSYRDLQAKLRLLRSELCQKYLEEFEALEQKVRTMSKEESSVTLFGILEKNVENVLENKSKEVECILATKNWAKWRAGELDNWNRFCASTKDWYTKRVDDMVSGIVKFEKVVADYERQIKKMIMRMMEDEGEWSMKTENAGIRKQRFEEFFEGILQKAMKSHPPLSEQISKNVLDRYRQSGLGKKFDLYAEPANTAVEKTNNWISWINSGKKRCSKQEELRSTLQTITNQHLRDARQYSEVIVDNVIHQTTKTIESQRLSNKDQQDAHMWVKKFLTDRMEVIQRRWDGDHNIVQKLRLKAKPRLYQFFESRAERLEAATMLIRELQSVFEDELEEAHSRIVVKKVAAQLGRAEWVMNWRVMRDCLDLHLLALTEKKDKKSTDMLLRFVSNGSTHFHELTGVLIRQAITTEILEQEWEGLVGRLETCLKEQNSVNLSVNTFLVKLSRKLSTSVDSKLASALNSSIHHEFYRECILDSDFYQQKVPEMCKSLRRKCCPDFDRVRESFIERVRERMVELEDESCRPRCDVTCPHCGITCFHSTGHVGKHDAIHQPSGLSGMHYVHSHELVPGTCLDSLNADTSFEYERPGNYIPYRDFEKVYPSWANPSKHERIAIEVREYVFFNYQPALVEYHNSHSSEEYKVKPCPARAMPSHFNHDAKRLRTGLYNRLRPVFIDGQYACEEALQHLLLSI